MEQTNRNSNSSTNENRGNRGNVSHSGNRGQNASDFTESLNREIMQTERKLDMLQQIKDSYDGGSFGNQNFSGGGRSSGYGDRQSNMNRSGQFDNNENLPTRGPRSGNPGDSNRAFSAKRFGNTNDEGIPIDKDGTIDERTKQGRLATDDEGYSDQQLQQFMETAARNRDDSIDLRTEEGRALRAAGYVDDQGWPVDDQNDGGNSGGSSRNRSNRARSGRSD